MGARQPLSFLLPDGGQLQFEVRLLINAGYAGRDREAVEHHIQELRDLGVPAPSQVPSFYPISSYLAIQADALQVQHGQTSGEVEFATFEVDGRLYVTVGSDHSDRLLERSSVPLAKQAYGNLLSARTWPYSEVAGHWDQLQMRSWTRCEGEWQLYQEGSLGQLWTPNDLLDHWLKLKGGDTRGLLLFSGTLPTVGGLKYGSAFRFELQDRQLGRSLNGEYEVEVLPESVE